MATRDLTVPYMRLRSAMHRGGARPNEDLSNPSSAGGAAGGAGLLGAAASATVDMTPLARTSPVYVDLVNEINGDINLITAKMSDLQKAHDARLRIAFNPQEENEKEREIEILTAEITRAFNHSANKLKRVANYTAAAETAEIKIRKNIQRGLATRLHELSGGFRGMQKTYLGQMQRMRVGTSLSALIGDTSGPADRDEGFTDEQMHELATAEEDVDERMREIQRIAKSVNDLAVLFKELATLVVEQGTILDRIDYNMEQAVENTKKGMVELKEAEKYQKSARPIKCMIVLMVLIIICVIIIFTA